MFNVNICQIAPEFYPKLLEKGLQVAESQAADSYHCKTLNCPGWCTYDEDVNFFECPVCRAKNCLTCQAIHENQNCKEYQDDLKRKAEIDVEARQTQEELKVTPQHPRSTIEGPSVYFGFCLVVPQPLFNLVSIHFICDPQAAFEGIGTSWDIFEPVGKLLISRPPYCFLVCCHRQPHLIHNRSNHQIYVHWQFFRSDVRVDIKNVTSRPTADNIST